METKRTRVRIRKTTPINHLALNETGLSSQRIVRRLLFLTHIFTSRVRGVYNQHVHQKIMSGFLQQTVLQHVDNMTFSRIKDPTGQASTVDVALITGCKWRSNWSFTEQANGTLTTMNALSQIELQSFGIRTVMMYMKAFTTVEQITNYKWKIVPRRKSEGSSEDKSKLDSSIFYFYFEGLLNNEKKSEKNKKKPSLSRHCFIFRVLKTKKSGINCHHHQCSTNNSVSCHVAFLQGFSSTQEAEKSSTYVNFSDSDIDDATNNN